MAGVRKINKKLNKTFGGQVEAYEESGCLVLTGELGSWVDVARAGMVAAGEKPVLGIVNDISCAEKPHPTRKPRVEDSQIEWEEPDVLIIGGGVIGCAVARELSRYNLGVLLVEKEHDLATQATGHSIGLVHSGFKLKKGTLRHWYTLQGNQMLPGVCEELGVPFRRCGQYLVYTNRLWAPFLFLSKLYWRWHGIKGINIIGGDEPGSAYPGSAHPGSAQHGVGENVGPALHFPSGGVVCPHTLAIAYAENSVQNGVHISLNTMVREMKIEDGAIMSVTTNRGTVHPKVVVNAAGAFCEDIAEMAGDRFYSIHPIKGTVAVIDKKHSSELVGAAVSMHGGLRGGLRGGLQGARGGLRGGFQGGLVRNVRNRRGLLGDAFSGLVRGIHDAALGGPFFTETMNKEDFSTDRYSLETVVAQLEHISPSFDRSKVSSYFSGIEAATFNDDFIVSEGRAVSNMVHAAGIQFPGLTASPAIAADVAKLVVDMFGGKGVLHGKPDFNPKREASPVLKTMEPNACESLISANSDYGVVVCHCEQVSRGEIIDSLGRNVRCDSIDGVKRRTRAGCGNCRGQRCQPAILEIISAENRLPPQRVRKAGSGSEVVYGSAAAIAETRDSAATWVADDTEGGNSAQADGRDAFQKWAISVKEED